MSPEQLIKCVELQLGQKGVKMEDRFLEDLGAESIDMVHLAVMIEEQTGLFMPIETVPDLNTVQDMYNYILSLA
jgi:acyl carrier protein